MFLLYWAGIEQFAWDKLAACVVGAIVGLLMAWLAFTLPGWLGDAGGLVFLTLILALIYCQVMGWLSVAIRISGKLPMPWRLRTGFVINSSWLLRT